MLLGAFSHVCYNCKVVIESFNCTTNIIRSKYFCVPLITCGERKKRLKEIMRMVGVVISMKWQSYGKVKLTSMIKNDHYRNVKNVD